MSGEMRRALAVAALLVVAGCAGSGGGQPEATNTAAQTVTEGASSGDGGGQDAGPASGESSAFEGQALADRRERVRTGEAELEVESFAAATGNLSTTARRLGGFVGDRSQRVHTDGNLTWTTGRLVLRVPKGNFSALMAAVREAGTVARVDAQTEDVTGRVVDLEARLENLRAERDRLRALYDDANETEDVLAVGDRLSEAQSEIERLEGRLQALRDRIAFSTVTVELREPRPDRPEAQRGEPAWWETGVLAAFLASVDGVVVALRALVVGLAYVAPFAAVFGTPLLGGYAAWRRFGGD